MSMVPPEMVGDAVYEAARRLAYLLEHAEDPRDPELMEQLQALLEALPDGAGAQLEALREAKEHLLREAAGAKRNIQRATALRKRLEGMAQQLGDMQATILEAAEVRTGSPRLVTDRGIFWLQNAGQARLVAPEEPALWPERWRTLELVTGVNRQAALAELRQLQAAGDPLPEGFDLVRTRVVRAE